jgi:hypothetical protein
VQLAALLVAASEILLFLSPKVRWRLVLWTEAFLRPDKPSEEGGESGNGEVPEKQSA